MVLMCTTKEKEEVETHLDRVERLIRISRDETTDGAIKGKLSAALGEIVLVRDALIHVA